MKFSPDKEIHSIVREIIQKNGWTFSRGKKHGRLHSPCGKTTLTIPSSPSCSRALKNFQRDAKRALAKINHEMSNQCDGDPGKKPARKF